MEIDVRLFGRVSWRVNDEIREVRGQTRTDVLLLLVVADGAVVRTDTILQALWADDPPASGRNAVQRHISGLRSELKALGVEHPAEVIQRVGDGYRAVGLVTDRMAAAPDVRWWEEPIQQASWDPHHVLRAQLVRAGAQRALQELRGEPVIDLTRERVGHLVSHSPEGPSLRLALPLAAGRGAAGPVGSRLGEVDAAFLAHIAGVWHTQGSAVALDVLDSHAGNFAAIPEDLRHRLYRWLVWLPYEPWVEHALTMVPVGVRGGGSERMVVSLDARALMQMPDGRKVAEAEIEAATDALVRERALRVRYVLGLAQPHDDRQDEIVRELGATDLADAQVEASRFRFLNAVRTRPVEEWHEPLADVAAVTHAQWLDGRDDFAALAQATLARSHDPAVRHVFGSAPRLMTRYRSDPFATLVADACARMLGDPDGPAITEPEYWSAIATMSASAGQAMRLLRGLQRAEPVEAAAWDLALRLPETVREKQFLLLPVALARVAEVTNNRDIAAKAFEALAPWAGQMLGLWPIDFVIGPADHWLDRLASV